MSRRRFYLDLDVDDERGMAAGDLLLGPRVAYLVLEARPTDTAADVNRWTLTVRTIGPRPHTPLEWEATRQLARFGAREVHYRPHPRGRP